MERNYRMTNTKSDSNDLELAKKMRAQAEALGQTEVVSIIDALSARLSNENTMNWAIIETKPGQFSTVGADLFPDFFSADVRNSDAEWEIPEDKSGHRPHPFRCFVTRDIRDWKNFCRDRMLWRKLIDADVVLFIIESRLKPSAAEHISYLHSVLDSRLFFFQSNSLISQQAKEIAEHNKKLLSGWLSTKQDKLHYFRVNPDCKCSVSDFERSISSQIDFAMPRRTDDLFRQIVFSGNYLLNLLKFYEEIDQEHTEWNKIHKEISDSFIKLIVQLQKRAESLLGLKLPRTHPPRAVREIINPLNREKIAQRELGIVEEIIKPEQLGKSVEDFFKSLRVDLTEEIREIVDEIDRYLANEIQNFLDRENNRLELSEMLTTDKPIATFSSSTFPEEEMVESPNFRTNSWFRLGRSAATGLYPAGFAMYVLGGFGGKAAAVATASNPIGLVVVAVIIVGGIFTANAYYADKRHQQEINLSRIKDELIHSAYDASGMVTEYVKDSLEKTAEDVNSALEKKKEIVQKTVALKKHHNSDIGYEEAAATINNLIKTAEEYLGSTSANR